MGRGLMMVGRPQLSAAAIVHLGGAGVNGDGQRVVAPVILPGAF